MHTSPANQRRREKARRRTQIARRRVVALVVVVTLITAAVWIAYAIPGQTPAQVPATAAEPTFGTDVTSDRSVVAARAEGVDVLLPVAQQVTTAIAFHPVDNPGAVSFAPVGDRLGGGDLGQKLADIFAGGGGVKYYLMGGEGGEPSSSTGGLDVGAVPGSPVLAPVDGKVTAIKRYKILGRFVDSEMDIRLASDPSLLLLVTHLAKPRVEIGDVVQAGVSTLGEVRGFEAGLGQSLSQYTSDNGDHVQLVVIRTSTELSGQ
jgi:murein DD-endopeptidase MepM/ murein hydrolase activator NlpD